MQWSLFVLVILDQCFSITCQLYQYRFITEKKNWRDAQTYCRTHHTDLATVMSMEDAKRLRKAPGFKKGETDAWIGLKHESDMSWHWSLPGVEFKVNETNWRSGQPDKDGQENCGWMWKDGTWNDAPCTRRKHFVCYDEKGKEFHLIQQNKAWLEAQRYCRKNHTDLVSGMTQLNNSELKAEANRNNSDAVFIGLFLDAWKWSDGLNVSFRNWDPNKYVEWNNDTQCAMTQKANGRWHYDKCCQEKPFFCYNEKLVLINDSKTWTDALDYCRNNYSGLASITTLGDQILVQRIVQQATTDYVWLALHYSCVVDLWFWVSDDPFCDDSSDRYNLTRNECDVSAAMGKQSPHSWSTQADNQRFNFICVK